MIHSQKLQLGPITHSKTSNKNNQCLQFWYSAHGQGIGKITMVYNKTNNDTFMFHEKEKSKFIAINSFLYRNLNSIDTNWKQIQRTISIDHDYELIFTYESHTSDYNYIAIDDISIIDGACRMYKKKRTLNIILNRLLIVSKTVRRKRRQTSISVLF